MDEEREARIAAVSDARLAAAFRDAAADVPPPGFDAADVVATSRRITRRRRAALAGGALAVVAVVGVGLAAGPAGGSGSELTTASAGSAPETAQDAGAPEAARAAKAPPEAALPSSATGAGSGDAGSSVGAASAAVVPAPAGSGAASDHAAGPLGPGTGECANRQDPALRALVEQVLPEVVGAPKAATTQECRPGGERGLALEVRDGATSGVLSVTYLPPGTVPTPVPGARSAPTASGGTVLVSTGDVGGGEPAPFAGRLDAVVAYLAPRL